MVGPWILARDKEPNPGDDWLKIISVPLTLHPAPYRVEPSWGLISAKNKSSDGKFLYCIDLNEGDTIGPPGISSDYIHPLEERIRLEMDGKVEQSFPHQKYLDLWNAARYGPTPIRWCPNRVRLILSPSTNNDEHRKRFSSPSKAGFYHIVGPDKSAPTKIVGKSLSYEDLFQLKCGKCYQCLTRPICGSCVGCTYNRKHAKRRRPKRICVQKVGQYSPKRGRLEFIKTIHRDQHLTSLSM